MRRGLYRHNKSVGRHKPILDHQFDHIANLRDLTNADGLGGKFGLFDTLWISPDGKAPVRWLGVPNNDDRFLQDGTLNPGVNPYRLEDGTDQSSTIFDISVSSSLRDPTTGIHDPALTDDAVIFCFGCKSEATATSSRTYSTRIGGQGWQVFMTSTLIAFAWSDAGGTVTRTVTDALASIFFAIAVVERSGQVTLFVNGVSSGGVAVPGGAQAGSGLSVACAPNGTLLFDGQIYACGHKYGSGISADWLADNAAKVVEFTNTFTGILPRVGSGPLYTRDSTRIYYPLGPNGRAHIVSNSLPPAGNVEGLGTDEQIVSVTDKNHVLESGDLASLNTRIDAGLVGTLQTETGADLAALQAALPWASGVVYDIDNPTGGTLYARFGNQVGVTSACWISIRARVISGTINLGFIGGPSSWVQVLAGISSNYVRNYGTANPIVTAARCGLEIPSGGRVRVILWCAGVGARVLDEVPSLTAFGVNFTVAQGVLTTAHTPSDIEETYDLVCKPRLWGAASAGDSGDIVSRSGGVAGIIAVTAGGNVTTTDGTSTPSAAMSENDGIQETLRSTHGRGRLYVTQSDQTPAEAAYDGSLAASGSLTHEGSCRSIQRLLVKRRIETGNHP